MGDVGVETEAFVIQLLLVLAVFAFYFEAAFQIQLTLVEADYDIDESNG